MTKFSRISGAKLPHRTWRYQRTDAGNAELFAAMFASQLRYDHDQGAWFIWREHWWAKDRQLDVMNFAIRVARARYRDAAHAPNRQAEEHWAVQSEMKSRINAAIELAKSRSELSTSTGDWKNEPLLLGVANGIVNLCTGVLQPGNPADMIRAHSPVVFEDGATCPIFQQFIKDVCNDNAELIAYIQRAIGYTLTGLTKEQIAFACHGEGANGKTTLMTVLDELLGSDYAAELPASVFDRERPASIPNDLMQLYGRRFVRVSELRDGAAINEARLKQLTGGDEVSARYLYQNFISFRPYAKIWLAFNHLPYILDDTHAFWRRVHVIPFLRTFRDGQADKNLLDRIRPELSGVLNWAIEGCLAYQRENLRVPAIISEAVQEYRRNCNPVLRFVDEVCQRDPSAETPVRHLREAFELWAKENGEPNIAPRIFAKRLKDIGFADARIGHSRTRGYKGIRVSEDPLLTRLASDADRRTEEDGVSIKQ
jgi:putative DNA primase/helicase